MWNTACCHLSPNKLLSTKQNYLNMLVHNNFEASKYIYK